MVAALTSYQIIPSSLFATDNTTAEKLKITLNVESLCPDCKNTVTKSFMPAIDNGLLDMVEVTYVTAGNVSSDGYKRGSSMFSFHCQHKEPECWGNIYETCMWRYAENDMQKYKVFYCMFNEVDNHSTKSEVNTAWHKCFEKFVGSIDVQMWIIDCSVNSDGFLMFDDNIKATPKHDFIP